jgi:hypothetical protein
MRGYEEYYLLGYKAGSFFDPEKEGDMFLRNVC